MFLSVDGVSPSINSSDHRQRLARNALLIMIQ